MNQDLKNELTRGKTFALPQAYQLYVIFVKKDIVYGLLTEPLTEKKWLTQYTWDLFQQLIGKRLV